MATSTKISLAMAALTMLSMFGAGAWTMSAAFHRLQVLEDDNSDFTQVQKDMDRLSKELEDGLRGINNRISAQWPKVGDNLRAIERLETWRGEISRDMLKAESRIDELRNR